MVRRLSWFIVAAVVSLGTSTVALAQEEDPEPSAPSEPGLGSEPAEKEDPSTGQPDEADETTIVSPLEEGFRLTEPMKAAGEPLDEPREVPELGVPRKLTVGRTVAWVPRVALFPAYLVADGLVRRPLGFVVTNVEEHHVVERVKDATTFGDGEGPGMNGGVIPRLRVDRNLRPAIGLEFYLVDTLFPGNDWSVGADTDFRENASADLGTQLRFKNDRLVFGATGAYERDADKVFHGIGPDAGAEAETRFVGRSFEGGIHSIYQPVYPGIGGFLGGAVSDHDFDCSPQEDLDVCGGDHRFGTDDDFYGVGDGELPYFLSGYQLLEASGGLALDTRHFTPRSGTGLRTEVFGTFGQGIVATDDIRFLQAGSQVGGYINLFRGRVLGLTVRGEVTEPIGSTGIPFTELSTLGGHQTMRGFLPGRFRGRSTLTSTLEYRYPIWSFVDGTVFAETGNAFGPWFTGFTPGALQGSFGTGFRSAEGSGVAFDLLFALGTTRFDEDLAVEFARLTVGTNWEF